ncbi:hypothetical protein PLESTF_001287200 [Pleodorina starrii]|nr:hypothetical protein PLESTF_001287200 [Pleodorina starrii]
MRNPWQRLDGAQPTPASVIFATAAVHAAPLATATAAAAARELRGARAPSQLTDELYQYATAAAAAGRRPGNDAFLAACLSDLSAPHRLRRLRPRQLAVLLRSLVHLGAHPDEDWLSDLDACCYCHPGPFDPASATAVLQALAALHTASISASVSSGPPPAAGFDSAGRSSSSSSSSSPSSSSAEQTSRAAHHLQPQHRHRHHRRPSQSYSSASSSSSFPSSCSSSSAASFRFPQAVYLRLTQGGVQNYTYEQLATLLQSFRSLGVAVSDELALQVGSRMAAQLLEMVPEQRHRALAAVLGAGTGAAA